MPLRLAIPHVSLAELQPVIGGRLGNFTSRNDIGCPLYACSVVSDCVTPWTVCSPPGSSVHGIFQPRVLMWVAISYSRGSSPPRDWTSVSCISRQIFLSLHHLGRPLAVQLHTTGKPWFFLAVLFSSPFSKTFNLEI